MVSWWQVVGQVAKGQTPQVMSLGEWPDVRCWKCSEVDLPIVIFKIVYNFSHSENLNIPNFTAYNN